MSKLSVEKLNDFKKMKKLTNKKIAALTGLSISTIDRLFSGSNMNPNINLLKKLSTIFECTVDDFMEYDKDSPLADYYENKETAKLAESLKDNPQLKMLLDASKDLPSEDLDAVITIAQKLQKTKY